MRALEFACHSSACRPPSSGGTGGSAPDTSYQGNHRPNSDGPTAADLFENDWAPADIYDHPEFYTGYRGMLGETMRQLNSARGNPEAPVTVYRAAPKGTTINDGDWITLSKTYALQHAYSQSRPGEKLVVTARQARAKEVRWAGDDLLEFGFFPAG